MGFDRCALGLRRGTDAAARGRRCVRECRTHTSRATARRGTASGSTTRGGSSVGTTSGGERAVFPLHQRDGNERAEGRLPRPSASRLRWLGFASLHKPPVRGSETLDHGVVPGVESRQLGSLARRCGSEGRRGRVPIQARQALPSPCPARCMLRPRRGGNWRSLDCEGLWRCRCLHASGTAVPRMGSRRRMSTR